MAKTKISTLAPTAVAIEGAIDTLALTRSSVDSRRLSAEVVLTRFSATINTLREALDAYGETVIDSDARVAMRQIDALGHLKEWWAVERGTLNTAFTIVSFPTPSLQRAWLTAVAGQEITLEQVRTGATHEVIKALDDIEASPAKGRLRAFREVAEKGAVGAPLAANAPEWWSAATQVVDQQRALETALTEALSAYAKVEATSALTVLLLVLAGSIGVLLVSVTAATQTIRNVLRATQRVTARAGRETRRRGEGIPDPGLACPRRQRGEARQGRGEASADAGASATTPDTGDGGAGGVTVHRPT